MIVALPPPERDAPETIYRVPLSEATFMVRLRYNSRLEVYHFDLDTLDDIPIVTGQLVKPLLNLLARARHPRTPPGQIFLEWTHSETEYRAPKLNEIGEASELLYWNGELDSEGNPI
jgi:hypothetical protein